MRVVISELVLLALEDGCCCTSCCCEQLADGGLMNRGYAAGGC